MADLWPHQSRIIEAINDRIYRPAHRLLISAPTGAGKSRCMFEIFRQHADKRIALYTHRRLLLDQLAQNLRDYGLEFGIRAAGHDTDEDRNLQLCMIQTEHAKKASRELHKADVVVIDEAHVIKSTMAEGVVEKHLQDGAFLVGFTATPLDLGHMYDELFVGATNRELRACGAHLPCYHYVPDTIDTTKLKRQKTGEYEQKGVIKAIMTPTIIARVIENYLRLNPEQKPAILFAPGVAESRWFAEQLSENGISAGHVDADSIWIDGDTSQNVAKGRQELLDRVRSGDIKVVCNRFILREGIDLPELYHGIFATAFGSVQSFLQAGGRLLRNHPSLSHVIVQDHGGNVLNHGSLNADRSFCLGDTARKVYGTRAENMREGREEEPVICSRCHAMRALGNKCPVCGHMETRRIRRVIQLDGTLRELEGKYFQPLRIDEKVGAEDRWKQIYYRARNSKTMTFRQARALYAKESGDWTYPSAFLPFMPRDPSDMVERVRDVPSSRLR